MSITSEEKEQKPKRKRELDDEGGRKGGRRLRAELNKESSKRREGKVYSRVSLVPGVKIRF